MRREEALPSLRGGQHDLRVARGFYLEIEDD